MTPHTWKLTKPRRPNGHWDNVIIPKAAEIADQSKGMIGLRGLFYRLLGTGDLYNNANEYTSLSDRLTRAREAGIFPDPERRQSRDSSTLLLQLSREFQVVHEEPISTGPH